jgi:hypothetical protein
MCIAKYVETSMENDSTGPGRSTDIFLDKFTVGKFFHFPIVVEG